jgi:hypothetical protein
MPRIPSDANGATVKGLQPSRIANANLLSAICYLLSHSSLRARMMRQDLFSDVRVRHGIKMGLAGLLALFCTQVFEIAQ